MEAKVVATSRWWAVLAFALTGCLYLEGIDPVNQPPEAAVSVLTPAPIYVGDEVVLSAEESRDPDGSITRYEWNLEMDVTGEGYEACVGWPECVPGTDPTCCFVPLARTTFTVTLTTVDDRGVRSRRAQRTIVVADRAPEAVIGIDTMPKDTGHFVVGQRVWFHAKDSYDPDRNDVLSYRWEPTVRPPGSSDTRFVFQPSTTDLQPTTLDASALYCLVVPDYPGSYEVTLTVSDGELEDSVTKHIEVDADEPPCIQYTNPDWSAEVVLVPAGQTQRLEVLQVRDDLDPYPPGTNLKFSWSILYDEQTGFVPVAGHDAPYLDVQPPVALPGTRIEVRVTVSDRVERDLSTCPEGARTCSLRPGCPQWVTWTIEYR